MSSRQEFDDILPTEEARKLAASPIPVPDETTTGLDNKFPPLVTPDAARVPTSNFEDLLVNPEDVISEAPGEEEENPLHAGNEEASRGTQNLAKTHPNLEMNSMENTQTFFMYKGKGKCEDIEREKAYRLRKIKKRCSPLDWEAIRAHEKFFLSEVYNQKERKANELDFQMKELQKSYDVKFKSKHYSDLQKNYKNERNSVSVKREAQKLNRDNAKKFAGRYTVLNQCAKERLENRIKEKFPTEAGQHTDWFFGRFGKEQMSKSVEIENNGTINKVRYEKGNEYFQLAKPKLPGARPRSNIFGEKPQEEIFMTPKLKPKPLENIDYSAQIRESRSPFVRLKHNQAVYSTDTTENITKEARLLHVKPPKRIDSSNGAGFSDSPEARN